MAEQTVRFEDGRLVFDGDIEVIKRALNTASFDYPVVYIPEPSYHAMTLNKYASDLIPDKTQKVYVATFMDYIAILPDDHCVSEKELFACKKDAKAIVYPANLKSKKIREGYYRVYPYRNGFAFNRFEPMDRNGDPIQLGKKVG